MDSWFHTFWEEDGSVCFANGGQSVQGVGLVRYKDREFSHFGIESGLSEASVKDKEGKFWFPTQEQFVVIDPKRESYNSLPPSVVVESVTVERKPFELRNGMSIEPGLRKIEIRFTGISMVKSNRIKFKYKLERHDSDWIEADTRRTAFYSYLAPGKYTFCVKAGNSDGVWSNSDSSLVVEIKPYFYQTNLFYLLCLALYRPDLDTNPSAGAYVAPKISRNLNRI